MAALMQMHWKGVTREQYDAVCERIDFDAAGARGLIAHVAAVGDDGLHVTDVWDSPEQFQRFAEDTIMPAAAEVGIDQGEPDISLLPTVRGWTREGVRA